MARWIYVVSSNCADPSREKEFNEWYDKVHLADVLVAPGYLKATRYENLNPGPGVGKYLAVYNIQTDDIERTMALHRENIRRRQEQGRLNDLLDAVFRGFLKRLLPLINRDSEAVGALLLKNPCCKARSQ